MVLAVIAAVAFSRRDAAVAGRVCALMVRQIACFLHTAIVTLTWKYFPASREREAANASREPQGAQRISNSATVMPVWDVGRGWMCHYSGRDGRGRDESW